MNENVNRNPLEVVAYHEAGHAVMAMSFCFPVYSITIVPQDGFNGLVTWGAPALNGKDTIRKVVLVKMAGLGADYSHWQQSDILGKNEDDSIGGLQSDVDGAEDLLSSIGEDGFAPVYGTIASRLLSDPERWKIVELVAQTLLLTNTIDASDAIQDISNSCPKITEEEFRLKCDVIEKAKEVDILNQRS